MLCDSCLTIILVSLHSCVKLKFSSSMVGDPIFNHRQCNGVPGTCKEFKMSVKKLKLSSTSTIIFIVCIFSLHRIFFFLRKVDITDYIIFSCQNSSLTSDSGMVVVNNL